MVGPFGWVHRGRFVMAESQRGTLASQLVDWHADGGVRGFSGTEIVEKCRVEVDAMHVDFAWWSLDEFRGTGCVLGHVIASSLYFN